jgi:two-component system response regulator NreC
MIRIFIADDHVLIRNGLRELLGTHADIEIVGEAADGIETLKKTRQLRPHVLILDVAMPGMNGLETAKLVHEIVPETRIVILSMFEKESFARQALQAGASGYVLKGASHSDIVAAIRAVYAGGYYFSARITTDLIRSYLDTTPPKQPSRGKYELLTDRERQVFGLLVEGHSTAAIAQILCVSYKTVEKHRGSISRKLDIANPIEMLKYAVRLGLVDPEFWES